MTSRDKILALAKKCRDIAEKQVDIAVALLDKADKGNQIAQALEEVLPRLTDEACDEIVATWDEETTKANLN